MYYYIYTLQCEHICTSKYKTTSVKRTSGASVFIRIIHIYL